MLLMLNCNHFVIVLNCRAFLKATSCSQPTNERPTKRVGTASRLPSFFFRFVIFFSLNVLVTSFLFSIALFCLALNQPCLDNVCEERTERKKLVYSLRVMLIAMRRFFVYSRLIPNVRKKYRKGMRE